ncbi:hypothetical protein [Actinomadura opuntiae]|uniref:hypothetical protein n=1 Tax=Actinomadura sp. OS1-43 TaxID=604315 RepID=UPI00255AFB3F|nr:hypothetical protein [Actinomadura sp. OS1-43]MDL4816159.1 hypothetical protein [Actinomadura sp. OS1-43]
MNIERLLKDAAADEMREVTRESLPPLALPAARRRSMGWWPVPVAAVLTVIAVVTVTVALRSTVRDVDALGAHEGGPPYFLATQHKGVVGVFDSWTGRKTADIEPSAGHYTALAAAAERRTFFLADEVGTCRTRIDKVTLRRDGSVARRTTLPGEFSAQVEEMAATADGRRVAFTDANTECRGDDVTIVESPSGRHQGWRAPSGDPPMYVWSLAWEADGHTLLIGTAPPESIARKDDSVSGVLRTLDTRTTDPTLAATSVALTIRDDDLDLSSFRPSQDGRTVMAVQKDSFEDVFGSVAVVELLLSRDTDRKTSVRILGRMTAQQIAPATPTDFRTTLDATGKHLLVSSRHDRAIFRMDEGRFHRLPDMHRTDLGLIAW